MELNKKLKAIRLSKGLTQSEVGELLGVTKQYISALEKGLSDISIQNIRSFIYYVNPDIKDSFDLIDMYRKEENKKFISDWNKRRAECGRVAVC